MTLLLFAGCKKDYSVSKTICFLNVNVTGITQRTASLYGSYMHQYSVIDDIIIYVSVNYDMSEAVTYYAVCDNSNFRYSAVLSDLTPSTTYYFKVCIDTGYGIWEGEEKWFTTMDPIELTIATKDVSDITSESAMCGGIIIDDGGNEVLQKGVCWNTSSNPTVDNNHTSDGNGTSSFTSVLTGLEPSTYYYVRAYAINDNGISYGEQKTFKTKHGGSGPSGICEQAFSVSDSRQVYFSPGNLQYKASTNTWRFADNQWDYIGNGNSNISSSYSGWIDLFGWGTSGYDHGAVCYEPWSKSTNNSDYYAYGNISGNLYTQPGNADWGYAVTNSGIYLGQWRTLTKDEWYYVLKVRYTESGGRFAKAVVNGINGLIILPDDWNSSCYNLSNINNGSAGYNSNTISSVDWEGILEVNGAVFLPAAGNRYNTSLSIVGSAGDYWSSSYHNNSNAYRLNFTVGKVDAAETSHYRCAGFAVRLVLDVE